MRLWRRAAVAALGVAALVCAAEGDDPTDWALMPLAHGRLVVWVVHPAAATWMARDGDDQPQAPVQLPKTVQEQTAGSFGTASSNVGQVSSSYGIRSSDLPNNVTTNQVRTAGPGNFGTSSSNVGQTAGSYGQTAGSYGEGLSTIATAGDQRAPGTSPTQRHAAEWDGLTLALKGEFPGLELKVKDVREEDLALELPRAVGTWDSPDVLVGDPLPWKWVQTASGSRKEMTLGTLGPGKFLPAQFDPSEREQFKFRGVSNRWGAVEAAIVMTSQRRPAAEAFVVWLSGAQMCTSCALADEKAAGAAELAKAVTKSVLLGAGVDAQDPDFAVGNFQATQLMALAGDRNPSMEGLKVTTNVESAVANDRLAVVEVRGVVSGNRGFGVAHVVVVERKNAEGKWRVLQVSPSLTSAMARDATSWLDEFAAGGEYHPVGTIEQAAPTDGDNRGLKPDLLWQPGHGAAMEVVEWQRSLGTDSWTGSRLFFVPDRGPHERSRVTAEFAGYPGVYRWRVWTLGSGGALALSSWRTMNLG